MFSRGRFSTVDGIPFLILLLGLWATPIFAQEPRGGQEGIHVCELVALPEGTTVVTGAARDSATDVALPGASISFFWEAAETGSAERAHAYADAGGRYAACPIPTSREVRVFASFPRRRAEALINLPSGSQAIQVDFQMTPTEPDIAARSKITFETSDPLQESSAIMGLVIDTETGGPLVGVQIYFGEGGDLGTVTGPDGRFVFDQLEAGDYLLTVERLGYQTAEEEIDMTSPTRATATVRLVPEAIAAPPLRVTVNRAISEEARGFGGARYEATAEEMARLPYGQLTDVIRRHMPGIEVRRDFRGCPILRARGGVPLIEVDGALSPDPCIIEFFGVDDIERIVFIPGIEASIRYGTAATNGVIQIETKRGGGR
jgi:hypothetical protein